MPSQTRSPRRGAEAALARIEDLFASSGWAIDRAEAAEGRDLLVVQHQHGKHATLRFAAEVKASAEARGDRVVPLLSQAVLQAKHSSESLPGTAPLAIISVPEANASLMNHITRFMDRYSPDVPYGVVADDGLCWFRGPGLEGLNRDPEERRHQSTLSPKRTFNLFTDHGQWMLKVLLAPEAPPDLLNGPRARFSTNIGFAEAAGVSAMTASRFLTQLRAEGFLDEDAREFRLVRRDELFSRWKTAATRYPVGTPARFLIRSAPDQQLHALVSNPEGQAWLGLFAAADALDAGHVSGIPPQVVVPAIPTFGEGQWRAVMPQRDGNVDLFVRETEVPVSTARGAVLRGGVMVTDIIQTWLDVLNHPARGEEQADLIYDQFLVPIIEGHE